MFPYHAFEGLGSAPITPASAVSAACEVNRTIHPRRSEYPWRLFRKLALSGVDMVLVARRVRILLNEGLAHRSAVNPHECEEAFAASHVIESAPARAGVGPICSQRRGSTSASGVSGEVTVVAAASGGQGSASIGGISPTVREGHIRCTNCKTATTPFWRYDSQGQRLCNTCGLFFVSAVMLVVTGNHTEPSLFASAETPRRDGRDQKVQSQRQQHQVSPKIQYPLSPLHAQLVVSLTPMA